MEKRDETMKSLPEQVMSYAEERPILAAALLSPGPYGAVKQALSRLDRSALSGSDPLTGPVAGLSRPEVIGAVRERLAVGAGQTRE